MSANVETMFYTRTTPWHGLGVNVEEAPTSEDALVAAGLDWRVIQKDIRTSDGITVPGFKANVRNIDSQVLGIVTDRYKVVQNDEAFSFTDALLGEGVTYETAGSLQNGRRVWILAKLPQKYIISGDEITPYMVFFNSHDGSGSIKVAMTPIRVVCQNTLNLALKTAKRSWSVNHVGNIDKKLDDAFDTLLNANKYMTELGKGFDSLSHRKVSDREVAAFTEILFPMPLDPTEIQKKNVMQSREGVLTRFYEAPDLKGVGKNGYRYVNAVSDFATHAKPQRERSNYRETLFAKTADGNSLIDKAYEMVAA